jgi:hypothetical protein
MSETSMDLLERTASRTGSWVRDAGVTCIVIVLLALSFTLGRASMGHSRAAAPVNQSALLQPTGPLDRNLFASCRPHAPC